jgi:hypothetical protein
MLAAAACVLYEILDRRNSIVLLVKPHYGIREPLRRTTWSLSPHKRSKVTGNRLGKKIGKHLAPTLMTVIAPELINQLIIRMSLRLWHRSDWATLLRIQLGNKAVYLGIGLKTGQP